MLAAAKAHVGGATHKATKKLYHDLKTDPNSAVLKAAIALAEAKEAAAQAAAAQEPEHAAPPVDDLFDLPPRPAVDGVSRPASPALVHKQSSRCL